jgi:hypothetical protein
VLGLLWVHGPSAAAGVAVQALSVDHVATERDAAGAALNQDDGPLAGALLRWDDPGRGWWAQWTTLRGDLRYTGRTQIGLPVVTVSRLTWQETVVGIQQRSAPRPAADGAWPGNIAADAGLGVVNRRIHRDIAPSPFSTRLTERIDWWGLRLRVQAHWQWDERWHLALEGWGERGLRTRLHADFYGVATPTTVRPGAAGGQGRAVVLSWCPSPAWRVSLTGHDSRQRYAASAPVPFVQNGQVTGSASYPGSVQRSRGLGVGLSVDWP